MVSMTEEAKRAALAGFDFFKGLTDREISDIAKLAEERYGLIAAGFECDSRESINPESRIRVRR